jgi:hypothetical protein
MNESDFDIDKSTIHVEEGRGLVGKTFDGREAVMLTSSSFLRIDAEAVVVREAINQLRGKSLLLPTGFDYLLGPVARYTEAGGEAYYFEENDLGIYRVDNRRKQP